MTPTTLTPTTTLTLTTITTQNLTLIDSLPALIVIFATTLLIYYGLRLVRAEGPEEQARAQKILAGCIIAGVLMALARPLAFWATGWDSSMQQGLPQELLTAVNNLLQLLMYIGVVVVIAGIIYGGIQLTHTNTNNTNTKALNINH